MFIVPCRYRKICLTTFLCLRVGEELYLSRKFIEYVISRHVLLARCNSAPIALRYGTSGPNDFSLSSRGLKKSFFTSSNRTTIGVLNGHVLSI